MGNQDTRIEAVLGQLAQAVVQGDRGRAVDLVGELVVIGAAPPRIVDRGLVAGMSVVGRRFRENELFVPEVLMAARAMELALKELRERVPPSQIPFVGKAVIGTVKGDLHDIGKNIVAWLMRGHGIEVIDLGVNVCSDRFLEAASAPGVKLLCMSALLTMTMPQMQTVMTALAQCDGLDHVKVLVGGAPVTAWYAGAIAADGYASEAATAVEEALRLMRSAEAPVRVRRAETTTRAVGTVLSKSLTAMSRSLGWPDPDIRLSGLARLDHNPSSEIFAEATRTERSVHVQLRQSEAELGHIHFRLNGAAEHDAPSAAVHEAPHSPAPEAAAFTGAATPRLNLTQFKAVLDSIFESVIVLDRRMRMLYANPVAQQEIRRIWGAEASWQDRPCHEVYCSSAVSCHSCPAQATLVQAGRGPPRTAGTWVHRVLNRRHLVLGSMSLDVSAAPLLDENGQPDMVVVTHRDETLRVCLANMAAKSEAVLDSDSTIAGVAMAGVEAGGYESQVWRRDPPPGRDYWLASHVKLRDGCPEARHSAAKVGIDGRCLDALESGRWLWMCGTEVQMQHYPDLREFVRARDHVVCDTPMASHLDLRPQAAAVHFPLRVMGELWGVFVAEFDLSLRTLTTGQLETLATFADFVRNQVERSVAEEHRLDQLRGVLHNARKPVNAAIALADWLRRLPPGEERDTIIDTMIGGLKLAATKLHSLAAVWHGLHQHSTYARFVRCDLVQTARVALDLFAPRAADAGVALVIAPPDGEAVVDTDSDVLQVILMELIDNSLCWFPRLTSKKRIVVEIRPCPSDGAWDMLVHDNGSGFTEHALEHAFELKPSTRASSGLGLPGAALAARSLGAELQILRQPRFSPGASVCLHLPTGVRHD